ncbi:MAG: alpha-galactosidase [Fermentimonas sp.]|nr:alpha-galactosidase [Fermentimonas sp.]MDD4697991.1 alpha-galactosidase [Fermentimonas sp.]
MKFVRNIFLVGLSALLLYSCSDAPTKVENGNMVFEISEGMQTRLTWNGSTNQLVDFGYTEALITENDEEIKEFTLNKSSKKNITDDKGLGVNYVYEGKNADGSLTKILSVSTYNDFPDMLITKVSFVNNGDTPIVVKEIANNRYEVIGGGDTPTYWSFQGESTSRRRDWILPVVENFYQRNYMGMNNSDYGGGIPVTALWRTDLGIAIGHVSLHPELVSLPVDNRNDTGNAIISMTKTYDEDEYVTLMPGETISSLEGFVQMYEGDCFLPLRRYSEYMQKSGIVMPDSEPDAFESMWCSWGYERTATFEEVLGTLPKVKELGIKWATVDDGFQIAEGDWDLDPKRFPGGDQEMIDLVKEMKKDGLKVQLWWAPLAADPGTKILEEHPEIVMLSKDGKPYDISWWNSYYMSPVAEATINETKMLVNRFIKEYDFDGLKLDGQHLNAVNPDYSEANHSHDPELAVRELPNFFKLIFDDALAIKPNAVIQNCPCGTCMSFYNMPYTNQVVSSDPTSSWQIRSKGLVYRAIIPKTAYFGDHVELSDNGDDFASSFGIGAVLGTKFTYPKNNPDVRRDYLLTPEKEVIWKKWFSLYDEKMLSTGTYLGGLYDIGYFEPEAHAIEKDGKMYYAFYADEWDGEIELRGLEKDKEYTVVEYATDEKRTYTVNGSEPFIKPAFKKDYLIEVY